MALTEKGSRALQHIKQHFPTGAFSAKELSDACGEDIKAATLTGVVNNGYLNRLGGSPVKFEAVSDLLELLENLEIAERNGCDNTNLADAKRNKNDEFYTRYDDIEAEVMKYRKQFRDKVVYLPCDDPAEKRSEFWSFFVTNFDNFGLKKLIATHYDESGKAYKIWIDRESIDGFVDPDGADALQESLQGNGDFRSPECVDILKECDIVCTNPPFSLFRDFISLLMTYNKKFLIIGNQNAFTYKETFSLIKTNKIWTGYNMVHKFNQPDGSVKEFGNVCWFTNLTTSKRAEELVFTKEYDEFAYPKYVNYDAIEVSRVANIPKNYKGIMGLPITFIDKYNPAQFEILACSAFSDPDFYGCGALYVGDRKTYARVLVKPL